MADITIQGNATDEAVLRFTQSGAPVLGFSVAENHRKKQGDQWIDDGTTFYNVSVWNKQAENLAGQIQKGQRVLVSGRFRSGEFEGKNGTVKTYEVTANHVGLVPKGESQQGGQQGGYQQQGYPQQAQQGSWGSGGGWGAPQQADAPF